jgi:transmembrane sensor
MLGDSGDSELQGSQPDKAHEQASMWLARLDRGLRPDEAAGLREWLKEPNHRHCILDMARLWHGADIVAVLAELFPAGPEPMKSEYSWRYFGGLGFKAAVVIGLVVLIVNERPPWSAMLMSWEQRHATCDTPIRTPIGRGLYSTAVGERRELGLPDSTAVTLNTRTCMAVTYSTLAREVYLPYGEATFQVAHDSRRPFFVRAGGRRFQAMGTNFNVRVLSSKDVELTVTQGDVKVIYTPTSSPETPAEARLRDNMTFDDTTVGALETALVEPGMQFVRKIQASELDNLLAWQRGMIFFKSEPLESALAEVDRYTNATFVLADDSLRDVRIAGGFRTGDVEGLLHTLRKEFLIDSRRDAQGRIVLTALPHQHES